MKYLIKTSIVIIVFFLYSNKSSAQTYFVSNTVGATNNGLGRSLIANSSYSVALGYLSQATGAYSFAAGVYSYASGAGSVALARGQASGSYAMALGYNSFAFGNYSLASGYSAKANITATYSVSLGKYAETVGTESVAIGSYTKTTAANSFVIGRGISTATKLANNQTNTLMIGFNSDIPTFYVGASTGVGTTGNVGIGTADTQGYKLAVKGSMIAEEMFVKLYANWPDYVFAKEYELKSLVEVEAFIQENNHLPNVPSEKEVKEEGINLGEMDAILLQKIEELTLYTIAQQKQLEEQKELLKKQNQLIQKLMTSIK